MTRSKPLDPVTIAFAKENCEGIKVQCNRCHYFEVIGFDGFRDQDLVMDLAKNYQIPCNKCGSTWQETWPLYPAYDSRDKWYGLEKAEEK